MFKNQYSRAYLNRGFIGWFRGVFNIPAGPGTVRGATLSATVTGDTEV